MTAARTWLAVFVVVALAPALARADDIEDAEDSGSLAAVQHQRFRQAHELQVSFASLPLDAFYKTVGLETGYTWHFSDRLAWEVIHGGYAYELDTGLRDQLQNKFQVQPTAYEVAKYYINSDLVWKPLYMKASFINHSVIDGGIFFLVGGGMFEMSSGIHPAANGGLGLRFFLSKHVSLRIDGRDNAVFLGKEVKQVLAFSGGLSFDFGSE